MLYSSFSTACENPVPTWPLVAEVKFTEWTAGGEMRHPVFLGLREDKRAEDVVREKEKGRGVGNAAGVC